MEWLIIYRDKYKLSLNTLEKLLENHDITATKILFDKIKDLQIETTNNAIKNVTHCIILDDGSQENELDNGTSFILGVITGKASKVFSLNNSQSENMQFFKNYYSFASENDLINYLYEQIKPIVHEEKTKQAFYSLFNDGIPFTADCFATHIASDNREICNRFLQAGIDINCRTKEGTPMLNVAIRSEQIDCVKWLLNYEPNIDAISKDRGYSAIMDAVWIDNLELTKTLIKKGADLNFIGVDGQNVLVIAVGIGNFEICKLLAENGANPDIKDKMNMSAFDYAKLFNKKEIVEVLTKYHKE